jgi:hypothetical protein
MPLRHERKRQRIRLRGDRIISHSGIEFFVISENSKNYKYMGVLYELDDQDIS